jgi:hypothetical protein
VPPKLGHHQPQSDANHNYQRQLLEKLRFRRLCHSHSPYIAIFRISCSRIKAVRMVSQSSPHSPAIRLDDAWISVIRDQKFGKRHKGD